MENDPYSLYELSLSCRSLLIPYQISFGTIYWTTVSEYLDELIEALIEKGAPFVSNNCCPYDRRSQSN